MKKIAINHKTALKIGFDCGLVNNLNIAKVYDKMKTTLKKPCDGYFYADDVNNFYENELIQLIESDYI
jgi:hypothetical protein